MLAAFQRLKFFGFHQHVNEIDKDQDGKNKESCHVVRLVWPEKPNGMLKKHQGAEILNQQGFA
jgi:hypothetical protein